MPQTDFPNQKPLIAVDTHTHTVLSGHAWSTLLENARFASEIGLQGLCSTEHAHALPGSTPDFFPVAHRVIPRELFGVRIYMGLELNIIDFSGNLDVRKKAYLNQLAFGIASLHDVCLEPGSVSDHTQTYLAVLENPYVDALGHPGTPSFPCDIEAVVRAAKSHNKLIEINNNSFHARKGGKENCLRFAEQCKKWDVRVCVASDAHFAHSIGRVHQAMSLLDEASFPDELIVNRTFERFEAYLAERARRLA